MHEILMKIDDLLYQNVKEIDILDTVTPTNYQEEKQAFFDSGFRRNPRFSYKPHSIDLFAKKRALYSLPIEDLKDEDLWTLYRDIVESFVDKLDQYESVDTNNFQYDSLRYFGEPSHKDITNAHFILHLPGESSESEANMIDAQGIVNALTEFADKHQYTYQMSMVDSMIANALVSGTTVKVNKRAKVNKAELTALAHHEMGVHLVTTLNARAQPIRALSLGSPVNTTTQEGLAILCEYLSGSLSLNRLKVLAMRVLAVQSMLAERNFSRTFSMLKEQFGANEELAFTITARVYRGGGFTKDYLYLQGFHQMLNAYEEDDDFNKLLCGKVSYEHLPLITRLIDKGILLPPKYISPAIAQPETLSEVIRFIAHAIK